ncbi:MAG: DedA family protein [Endozoicomonas sp.]
MTEFLLNFSSHPWVLAGVIVLATYILEDAAIISAALMSADGIILPELAFLALLIGIFTGDAGLYGIGRCLGKWSWLDKKLDTGKVRQAGQWLERRLVSTIFLVRLVPGLRLPSYVACGAFRLPFGRYLFLIFLASLIWTAIIFLGFFAFGTLFWSELAQWKWLMLPVLVLLILIIHRRITIALGGCRT